MTRKGMSALEVIGGLAMLVIVLFIVVKLMGDNTDKFTKDVDHLQACNGLVGSLGGSKGVCSPTPIEPQGDKYYQGIGEGWGCKEGERCYLELSTTQNARTIADIRDAKAKSGQSTPVLEMRYILPRAGVATTPLAHDSRTLLTDQAISGLSVKTTFAEADALACTTVITVYETTPGAVDTQLTSKSVTGCNTNIVFADQNIPVYDGGEKYLTYWIVFMAKKADVAQPITVQSSLNQGLEASAPVETFEARVLSGKWSEACTSFTGDPASTDVQSACNYWFKKRISATEQTYIGPLTQNHCAYCKINRASGSCSVVVVATDKCETTTS